MPDRREFLKRAALGAAGLVAACGWDGGPLWPLLRAWDRPNRWLQQALAPPGGPHARIEAAGSESASFPQYFISPMMPRVDPAVWRLEVSGMVRRPLSLTLSDLAALPRVTLRLRHYCIEGWTSVASWTGVRLAEIARVAGADPAAGFVDFRSFDAGYWSSWDRESALHPQTLIAIGLNGSWLTPGHGAPARLYSNLKYGYKSVKYLTDIRFVPESTGGYWEDKGYDWYASL
ncbi:MAG TPA: molybdopterin-dependent oxidoreductase [Gemmatimonadota bacterium]|jgi:DMSO/TMAO reductase YedYZ molybdopterin-dependent catalytic subunit|nr:molybdopterin-dependent oxidoreductase [Gemmatimonadota bacterium]